MAEQEKPKEQPQPKQQPQPKVETRNDEKPDKSIKPPDFSSGKFVETKKPKTFKE